MTKGTQKKLEEELERIQGKLGLGFDLLVVWMPKGVKRSVEGRALSGEAQGKRLFIYERDEMKALETLRHEFLDYIISHEIEGPYMDLINRLIAAFQSEMYKKKEKVIERLRSVI